jgi:hypothetical protein
VEKNMKQILVFVLIAISLMTISVTQVKAISNESDGGAMLTDSQPVSDPRIEKLRSFLAARNSPVAGEAETFIYEADKNNLDWKLVVAISGLESSFCRNIPAGSYNCWGWGIPTGAQSGVGFASFKDGIAQVSAGLRQNYLNHGLITVEQIGNVYAASPTWAFRVRSFLNQIDNWQNSTSYINLDITI